MTENLTRLMERAEQLITRIEAVLPQPLGAPDWSRTVAWRYRKRASGMGVLAATLPSRMLFSAL